MLTQAFRYDPAKEFDLDDWIADIYATGKGKPHWPTINKYADIYWDAVKNGYGTNIANTDILTPDGEMAMHLANNVYQFAAAKNFTHLSQLTALINDNGRIREWKSFKEEATKLNLKYNSTYLKTEYDLALAGATMASKWVEFEKTGATTMLRYNTVGDARVRDTHRAMHNITLPIGHSFWATHYPPNGFKCRCDVDRIPYSSPQTSDDAVHAIDPNTVPPLFRTNLAKDKLVFPKGHPYFKGEVLDSRLFNFTPLPIAKVENNFIYSSEACKPHTNSAKDLPRQVIEYNQRMRAAKAMSKQFNESTMLLPKVEYADEFRYNIFFNPNKYAFAPKAADCILLESKTYFDVKSYENDYNNTSVKNMLKSANGQAHVCVIVMRHNKPISVIKQKIMDRIIHGEYKNLKSIYVLLKDETLLQVL
jgi:hypothetical protein